VVSYLIQRLIQAIVVIVLVSILIFLIMRLLPADPILIYMSQTDIQSYSTEKLEEMRHELGLDRSLPIQYFKWMANVLQLDLGTSFYYKEKVSVLIGRALPKTVHIGILAFLLSAIVGVLFGVLSAIRRGSWIDNVITLVSNLGVVLPTFWLGILLIYLFAFKLEILPTYGYTSPFDNFWLSTKQIILPVLVLCALPLCLVTRQTRSSMLEIRQQDYIRTAWSKGLKERLVVQRHMLKNSLIPVITVIGMGVPHIFAGSVLVETVFNISGMGQLLVNATNSLDYNLLQGGILIIVAVVVFTNLLVDISYSWIDPRVRY
jgi:peptide/nickel transport system permease protein